MVREPAILADGGVHAQHNAHQQCQHRSRQRQLQRGGQALGNHLGHRALEAVGNAQIPMQHLAHIGQVLQRNGLVKPQLFDQGFTLLQRGILAQQTDGGIANVAKHHEGNERDGQQYQY